MSPQWNDFDQFKKNFKKTNDVDFILFCNNRNIRRKQPGDVLKTFADVKKTLKNGDRKLAGCTAPAHGLYSLKVIQDQMNFLKLSQ